MGEQRLAAAKPVFEPAITQFGVSAIAGELALGNGIGDQRQLATDDKWLVKWNWFHKINAKSYFSILLKITYKGKLIFAIMNIVMDKFALVADWPLKTWKNTGLIELAQISDTLFTDKYAKET
jgi:hypothetical protein